MSIFQGFGKVIVVDVCVGFCFFFHLIRVHESTKNMQLVSRDGWIERASVFCLALVP